MRGEHRLTKSNQRILRLPELVTGVFLRDGGSNNSNGPTNLRPQVELSACKGLLRFTVIQNS